MQRGLAVIVLAALCTGCFALQRTPHRNALQSFRTIAIVPLEAPAPEYRFTPRSSAVGLAMPGALGIALLPILIPVGIYVAGDYAQRTAAIPETPLTAAPGPSNDNVERTTAIPETPLTAAPGPPNDRVQRATASPETPPPVVVGPRTDNGVLTAVLARAASKFLERSNMPVAAYVANDYLHLPLTGSSGGVQFEIDTRFRRWYNEDTANVDYSGLNVGGVDAILEVGVSDFLYNDSGLVLQVHARLVNPETKAVLGRARNKYTPPFSWRGFWRQAKPPRTTEQQYNLAVTEGSHLMLKCLKDLRLLRDPE